jgi:hypothetical protein
VTWNRLHISKKSSNISTVFNMKSPGYLADLIPIVTFSPGSPCRVFHRLCDAVNWPATSSTRLWPWYLNCLTRWRTARFPYRVPWLPRRIILWKMDKRVGPDTLYAGRMCCGLFLQLHSSGLQRCQLKWTPTDYPQQDDIEHLWIECFFFILRRLSRVTAAFLCFSQCFIF